MTRVSSRESKSGVGRPKKKGRSKEILTAGFQEFAEKGFDAARLDNVAARAGVAKGTLYLYYDSKEALFEAAVQSRLMPVLSRVGRLLDFYPGPTPFLLKVMIRLMYRQIATGEMRTLLRIIIAESERFPGLADFYYDEFMSKMIAILTKVVERGIARGELREGPATRLPLSIMSPGIMAAIWQMTFNRRHQITLDEFLEAHLDLVMQGVSMKT